MAAQPALALAVGFAARRHAARRALKHDSAPRTKPRPVDEAGPIPDYPEQD